MDGAMKYPIPKVGDRVRVDTYSWKCKKNGDAFGRVIELRTPNLDHTRGIFVKLHNGQGGRVQEILPEEPVTKGVKKDHEFVTSKRRKRDQAEVDAFVRENPDYFCANPFGTCLCEGIELKWHQFVVDHIKALANGGADKRTNMQYLCGCCDLDKTHEDMLEYRAHKRNKCRRAQSRVGA